MVCALKTYHVTIFVAYSMQLLSITLTNMGNFWNPVLKCVSDVKEFNRYHSDGVTQGRLGVFVITMF